MGFDMVVDVTETQVAHALTHKERAARVVGDPRFADNTLVWA